MPKLRLPAQPLLDRIDLAVLDGVELAPTDRTRIHRARRSGLVSELIADELACRYLRLPIELIYGPIDDQEPAA